MARDGGKRMTDKLTPEQLQNKFEEIGKNVDAGRYVDAPKVYKKRVALLVLGEYLPQYDALSDDEKQNFGFDVNGLVKKVKDLVN